MSKTETRSTSIKDTRVIELACEEMGIAKPASGTASLYQQKHKNLKGTIVHLPGWSMPVIINTETGELLYDNHNGNWGDIKQLNKFTQLYSVHAATLAAKKKGWTVQRKTVGSKIELSITGM